MRASRPTGNFNFYHAFSNIRLRRRGRVTLAYCTLKGFRFLPHPASNS